ncbi:MAG TPA: hypothetical protein VJ828_08005 [Lacipirellulaceae bacterium]|nr:hypothetical protein [Lacipirellulaceae bacterium]
MLSLLDIETRRLSTYCLAFAAGYFVVSAALAQAPPAANAPDANKPAVQLSEDECVQFARSMEAALKQSDLKAFDRLVD